MTIVRWNVIGGVAEGRPPHNPTAEYNQTHSAALVSEVPAIEATSESPSSADTLLPGFRHSGV